MKTFGSWTALVLMALVVGCGKSEPSVPGAAKEDPAAKALAATADKPEVYVQTVFNSLAAGDSKALWNALPTKYQGDVKSLKDDFAGKMDAEIWNKAFVVVGKIGQVLKTKKELLLKSEIFGLMVPPMILDSVGKNWDTIVGLIDAIAQSEVKTIAGLKAADPSSILGTTGNSLLGSAMKIADSVPPAAEQVNKVRKVKVSLVKVDGDTATLKIETEGEPAKDDVFKKVDGKWLPAPMVADWDKNIATAKANLAELQFAPEQKAGILEGLTVTEQRIDALLAAKDQGTFDKDLGILMSLASAFSAPPPGALGSPGTPGGVPTGAPPTTGPGSFPPPGSLPKPAGSIMSPTLPGTGTTPPPSSALPGTPTLPTTPPPSGASPSTGPTLSPPQ